MIKLYNDDCLKVLPTLEEKSIDFVLTDLPYGTTNCKWDEVISFNLMWQEIKRVIKDKSAVCLFGSEPFSSYLRMSNIKWFKYDWIWEKQKASNFMSYKYSPLKYHEIISVFSKTTHNYYPQRYKVLELSEVIKYNKKEMKNLFVNKDYDRFGTVDRRKNRNDMAVNKEYLGTNITRTRYKDDGFRSPKSVLKINKQSQTNVHPTQKPVALLKYLIKTYTNENETVLDFTMGSGSTGVACKHLNRNFIGVELDAEYFSIAKKRIDEVHTNFNFKENKNANKTKKKC